MYLPPLFKQTDEAETLKLIRSYPFATVMTWDESGPYVNHLPVMLDERGAKPLLISHLARANPQLAHLEEGREVIAVFNGPHAYISPSWYPSSKEHVPTWSYAVAHVRGRARVVGSERLREILDLSVAPFETAPSGYRFSSNTDLSPEFQTEMMKRIAGFEIEISLLEGKFKIGQNRKPEDYAGVIEGLGHRSDDMSRGVRELMLQRSLRGKND
jgi:transcriptional regulator